MLRLDDTFLVLVDVQTKLAAVMHDREAMIEGCRRVVACMRTLQVPVLWTEQLPAKIGPTVPELTGVLDGLAPVVKSSFSCWSEPAFASAVRDLRRKRALLAGIETHVCVYQTASDLFAAGYHVEVLHDAVASRSAENRDIGLDRIRVAGGSVTSVETAVFELMRTSEHPAFREILKIIK
jgi:nicotinamidase-related amidase